MLLFHDSLDIFHHHNGIINHNTDGKHESEKGEHIEGESQSKHDSECTNQ